jgi:hypothetical protein
VACGGRDDDVEGRGPLPGVKRRTRLYRTWWISIPFVMGKLLNFKLYTGNIGRTKLLSLFKGEKWNYCLLTRTRKENLTYSSVGKPRRWIRYSNPREWLHRRECGTLPVSLHSNNLDDNSPGPFRPVWHDGFWAFPSEANVEVPGEWSGRLKVVREGGMVEKFEVADLKVHQEGGTLLFM